MGPSFRIPTVALVVPLAVFMTASGAQAESLRDAVRFALTTNPAITASQADMKATAYELMQLRGEYLPTVQVFGETGWKRVDDPDNLTPAENDNTIDAHQIGVSAGVVIFDGFRRANLVYANAARVDGSIFRLLDASETMALNASEAYIDVVRHRALRTVAQRNVTQHEAIAERVRALVAGGRLPYSDELTIDDRITSARLALLEVERALRDADARYERVIGRKPSGSMALQSAPVPASLTSLTQTAVKNSFRLQYAQTQVDETRFQQEVILSDRLPQLTLRAGVSRDINQTGGHTSRSEQSIGLGLNWTIYQGGRKAERNALAQRTGKAISDRELAVREVHELAARSWNNYLSNSERSRTLNQQLRINRLIVTVYGEEFEAAKRTLLDLLEVERARFNVEFQQVSANASLAFSTFRMLAAQSLLAGHFGIAKSDIALEPAFQDRAKVKPTGVFNVAIEPMK